MESEIIKSIISVFREIYSKLLNIIKESSANKGNSFENLIFEEKNKNIDDYKNIINRIEKELQESIKERKESRNAILNLEQKLEKANPKIAQNSLKSRNAILNLEQKLAQNSLKISKLEKSNSLLVKVNQEQKMKIQNLENEIKNLMTTLELSTKENNKNLKMFRNKWRELKNLIIQLKDGNQFLLNNFNNLSNTVNQFIIYYQIFNPEIFDEVEPSTDFFDYNFYKEY